MFHGFHLVIPEELQKRRFGLFQSSHLGINRINVVHFVAWYGFRYQTTIRKMQNKYAPNNSEVFSLLGNFSESECQN